MEKFYIKSLIAVALLLSLQLPSRAQAKTDFNLCYQDGSCTAEQEKVWNEYKMSRTLLPSDLLKVYSGVCYHQSAEYDGSHPHHALAILDVKDGQPYYGGEFAFFYESNPYAHLSLTDARKQFGDFYKDRNKIMIDDDSGLVDTNPNALPMWRYYMRIFPQSNDLMMIGFWGVSHTLFCRLSENK